MGRFLVTGGAGFIGSHLTARLIEEGAAVRVLDNLSTGSLANLAQLGDRVEFLQGDVTDPECVARSVEGVETVFHQAALASVPRSVERPLETHHACATGTVTLLDACRRADVRRVVYAGSSSAYGDQPTPSPHTPLPEGEGLGVRESQLPQVLSPYAAAKLSGELYCQAFAAISDVETVCLRYFNVFGPRQDPDSPYAAVIPLFVSALMSGRRPTIFGDGKQSRDFTYVANVVEANLLASRAEGVSGKVYNIACGESITVLELLEEICRQLDKPFDPEFAPPRPGDVLHSRADIAAAQRDLGYTVRIRFAEGLQKTLALYKGMLNEE